MSMELIGLNPQNKFGLEFQLSAWQWRPLWDYCRSIAPDLIDDLTWRNGQYNDGALVQQSSDLAERIKKELALGNTAKYIENLPKSQYQFDIEVVEHFVKFLECCGGFEIW